MPLTQYQLGYLAGLLDGEGSLIMGTHKEKRSRTGVSIFCNVRITNTNLNLLNAVNEIYLGKIYRSNNKNKTRLAAVYNWQVQGQERIVDLLEQLLPYLIVKKDRAEKMIEFCKSRLSRPNHKSGYTIAELNLASGWQGVPTNSGKGFNQN